MPPRVTRAPRKTVLAVPEAGERNVVSSGATQKSLWPVVMVLTMLFLIAVSVAGYFYYQYQNAKPGVADAKEIKQLTETIGAVMLLPEGEEPTLATVTDREKLAEQPFFQKAENGDKVLIYTNNGRAILYRPSTGKIVDVTTVNVNQPVASPSEASAVVPEAPIETPEETVPTIVRLALLNGSTTVGITNATEKQLTAVYQNLAVVSKETAQKNDYEQTIVVDVTGQNVDLTKKMAETLGGIVAGLPNGETSPVDADVLVIVGKK